MNTGLMELTIRFILLIGCISATKKWEKRIEGKLGKGYTEQCRLGEDNTTYEQNLKATTVNLESTNKNLRLLVRTPSIEDKTIIFSSSMINCKYIRLNTREIIRIFYVFQVGGRESKYYHRILHKFILT